MKFHDDALPSSLFQALRRRVVGLGSERLRATYQTTFWFPLSASVGEAACKPGRVSGATTNVVEEAGLALARFVPLRGVVGVEWWLSRMKTTNVMVDFHVDRDEKLALRSGRVVSPLWSSVLFLNRTVGGLLAVTSEPPCEENPAKAPVRLDFDLAAPRPNRFVVFGGSLTHGVLDAENRIPGRRLRYDVPLRLAVILNWWQRRPEDVPMFEESKVYRRLAR